MNKVCLSAIKSGHIPKLRDWRNLPVSEMRQGEKVCAFIERHVVVPEGDLVGTNIKLSEFQEVFIQAIFDGEVRASRAILSVGRKAGKTTVISCLLLAFMFMRDLISKNSCINSAALSRDQSALVFKYMSKSLEQSKTLQGLYKVVPSKKRIVALKTGIEYQALAADAGKAMGQSPAVLVGDEWGAVVGSTGRQYDYIQSLLTAQGAHKSALSIIISTSAPSDADWLSIQIDDATRAPSPDVVCHYYHADKSLAIDDPEGWKQACPAIGVFRSLEDVKRQADQALRLPTLQASFENLILNRRVALDSLWLAPQIWKENGGQVDMNVFKNNEVSLGLDLSRINDLSCATISAKDDVGNIHVKCYSFTPLTGISDRANRDRVPYVEWVKSGHIYAPHGRTLDYDQIAQFLKNEFEKEGIDITSIHFDRWEAKDFFSACDRVGFAMGATRHEVGQGFVGISPRIKAMETALLQVKIRHGNNQPVLNLGASSAIIVSDPSGNRKIDKSKSTQKIDGVVAMMMSVYPLIAMIDKPVDVSAMIG